MKTLALSRADKEMLKVICEQAPDGITIADVRRAIKVIDAVEAAGDELALEDADHQYLLAKFEGMKFTRADRMILDLFDRVRGAGG